MAWLEAMGRDSRGAPRRHKRRGAGVSQPPRRTAERSVGTPHPQPLGRTLSGERRSPSTRPAPQLRDSPTRKRCGSAGDSRAIGAQFARHNPEVHPTWMSSGYSTSIARPTLDRDPEGISQRDASFVRVLVLRRSTPCIATPATCPFPTPDLASRRGLAALCRVEPANSRQTPSRAPANPPTGATATAAAQSNAPTSIDDFELNGDYVFAFQDKVDPGARLYASASQAMFLVLSDALPHAVLLDARGGAVEKVDASSGRRKLMAQ